MQSGHPDSIKTKVGQPEISYDQSSLDDNFKQIPEMREKFLVNVIRKLQVKSVGNLFSGKL